MEPQFNKFVSFTLTEEEQAVGEIFHSLQMAHIQNERAKAAQLILNLEFDTQDPMQFGLDRAHLDGQIKILDYLIEISNRRSKILNDTQAGINQPTENT